MKKSLILCSAVLFSLIFAFLPFPASDLILRIYFDDIKGAYCHLYYATDQQEGFTEERRLTSAIDMDKKMVAFRLDRSLEGHLVSLRLDWPEPAEQLTYVKDISMNSDGAVSLKLDLPGQTDRPISVKDISVNSDGTVNLKLNLPEQAKQPICVKSISVSSGGVIQKQYNPCDFFSEDNVILSNETTISLIQSQDRAYFKTDSSDSYLVLSEPLTREIGGLYSRRPFSRLLLCLFPAASCLFARKKLFV